MHKNILLFFLTLMMEDTRYDASCQIPVQLAEILAGVTGSASCHTRQVTDISYSAESNIHISDLVYGSYQDMSSEKLWQPVLIPGLIALGCDLKGLHLLKLC